MKTDPDHEQTEASRRSPRGSILKMLIAIAFIGVLAGFIVNRKPPLAIPETKVVAEWREYGGDAGGSRYSKLDEITRQNVMHLEKVWEYHTGDVSDGHGDIESTTAFEATPIVIGDTLYFPSPFNRIIALDPRTGEEKWTYDPEIDLDGDYANQLTSRGVSYWEDAGNRDETGGTRIFAATNDARLIALDAKTGQLCSDFGEAGQIDLNKGPGEQLWQGEYQVTSPPAVAGDLVIVGSAVGDNARINAPSGVVRAYDARSGILRWSWDLAPPDAAERGLKVSQVGYVLSTPNVWAPMSVDLERDLLFVPTGNPTPDYFGGHRNGLDYYGSSVVALRASTGEVVWNYQTVHHDLWDFDVPAQPTLTHIVQDGERIPVVVQATKMGLLFVLHRETGEPVFGVEERPVPQTTVPGEYSSPTQPFPLKPPPLVPHTLTAEDAWGIYWGDKGACRERLESLYFEGPYTPPRVNEPTLMYPGNAGGSNWGGVAVDGERQILIANVMDMAWVVTLIPADEIDDVRQKGKAGISRQAGTPFGMRREMLVSPLELPCNSPPWGTLAAVDLNAGEILWQKPFGTVRDLAPVPIPVKLGVPSLGGPLITASGLIFIGASMDDYLRAFDIDTGEELWKGRLPAGGQATPMTYRLDEEGPQYVVIAAGGHGVAGTKLGDSLVAFALPR